MPRLLQRLFLAVICGWLGTGYMPAPRSQPSDVDLSWFYEALENSDHMELLEGLPHPMWEKEERAQETKAHETLSIADELFYTQFLSLETEQQRNLTASFQAKRIFVPPKRGELTPLKLCGGFHADYGVQWQIKGKPVATALICFGCHEIKLVGVDQIITADMTKEGHATLASILKPLRNLRPPFRNLEKLKELKKHIPAPERPGKIEIKP